MITPLVEELAKDYEGKAVIGKVDVDNNPGITSKYGVRNIPTILFFKNGQVVDKQIGAVPKQKLAEKLDALLK
jgi:thioredoxin 1